MRRKLFLYNRIILIHKTLNKNWLGFVSFVLNYLSANYIRLLIYRWYFQIIYFRIL
jgi:hypothetical protein